MALARNALRIADAATAAALAARPLASAADRARHDRMRSARARTGFAATRALAADMLRERGIPEPQAIRADPRGRPFLPPSCGLSISISHTDTWVAVALAADDRCGVDVQSPLDPRAFTRAVLQRYLPPGWADALADGGDATAPATLTRMWATVEAALKWRGTGFAHGLDVLRWEADGIRTLVHDDEAGRSARVDARRLPDGSVLAHAFDPPADAVDVHVAVHVAIDSPSPGARHDSRCAPTPAPTPAEGRPT
ncbi:hypothetical protein FGG90_04605 [Clavibacter tessellarius]|uniref:Uncharacterized protein n=1 Tax=Clavibacter tessellarius TaxID=31965 RepID=A0A225CG17_9MICO|nr:4'-phosphopantetheinyl transferase superfamily protein [Clavibacter michiganensis]OQJ63681.1 hypothetical protein B5P24_12110 [Clavibacter michiganensis subsp. tessellarius]UKF33340.1 hypothetical protein FGG90_04605 [Clavibacter michiganensis subsp. tessellarius]